MNRLSRYLALLVICSALATEVAPAQTTTVIPANEAAAHIGEYATVEGVVAQPDTFERLFEILIGLQSVHSKTVLVRLGASR